MAEIVAVLNQKTAFDGGADVIKCKLIHSSRSGVQIQADGVVLENCAVRLRLPDSEDWHQVDIEEGSGPYALVGENFMLAEIEVSGVGAGDWEFIFRQ